MAGSMDRHFADAIQADSALQYIPRLALERYFKRMLWKLYDEDKDQVLFTAKKWFITITVTTAHLRPFIERWAGPRPNDLRNV
jgi:hypothetical protein